jgi:hypothetical protein
MEQCGVDIRNVGLFALVLEMEDLPSKGPPSFSHLTQTLPAGAAAPFLSSERLVHLGGTIDGADIMSYDRSAIIWWLQEAQAQVPSASALVFKLQASL